MGSVFIIGSAKDVESVRSYLKQYGNEDIKIISKIERPSALVNLDEIIETTDAIMVARGDLGVEIDTWDVPIAQKEMCRKCNMAGKPVIVATQMLESMTLASRPTRAETTDVFNAVLDGADAVMLSGETSVGKYPVQTIKIMDSICGVAEKHMGKRKPEVFQSHHVGMTETTAMGCFTMAQLWPKLGWTGKVLVVTGPPSGYVARMVSKFRPPIDIITITDHLRTALELNLVWGVRSVYDSVLKGISDMESRNKQAVKKVVEIGLLKKDDHVLIVSRSLIGKHVGSTACIYDVAEVIKPTE